MQYIPALDGFRAIAVLLVFLFHRGYIPGGWIGVDIFFVLSGYLITSILTTEYDTHGTISLRRFYIRRLLRLLPALTIAVGLAMAIAIWLHSQVRDTTIDAISSMLYVEDYRYALDPPAGETDLGHLWSLSVEEQFYIVWPFLLILILRNFGRDVSARVVGSLVVLIAAWRIFLIVSSNHLPFHRVYCAFDTRADDLLMGCALAFWGRSRSPVIPNIKRFWPAAVLLLAAFAVRIGIAHPIALVGYPLISISAASLILVLTTSEPSLLSTLLSLRPLVALGRISYGFYLWHYIIIQHFGLETPPLPSRTLLCFLVSVAIAIASYWLIEKPLLRYKFRVPVGRPSQPEAGSPPDLSLAGPNGVRAAVVETRCGPRED